MSTLYSCRVAVSSKSVKMALKLPLTQVPAAVVLEAWEDQAGDTVVATACLLVAEEANICRKRVKEELQLGW